MLHECVAMLYEFVAMLFECHCAVGIRRSVV